MIYRVGLTGGAAAGKTTFAAAFKRGGLLVVNLDDIGREITKGNKTLLEKIAKIAGDETVSGDDVDRPALRKKVFADPGLRRGIEDVLHPAIWKKYNELEAEAIKAGRKVIVCEAALFVESGKHAIFDELIVVHAPSDVRLERLLTRPGISPELALRIVKAQVSDDARLAKATTVVENHGSEKELEDQANKLIEKFKQQKLL